MNALHRRGSLPYGELLKAESTVTNKTVDAVRAEEDDASGFQAVGLFEYLDTDDRPIFALDLKSKKNKIPVYQNAALRKLQVIGGGDGHQNTEHAVIDAQSGFLLDWAVSYPEATNIPPSSHWGIRWTGRTLRNKWRIITGNVTTLSPDSSQRHSQADSALSRRSRSPSRTESTGGRESNASSISKASLEKHLAAFNIDPGNDDVVRQTHHHEEGQHKTSVESHLMKIADIPDDIGPFDITRPNTASLISPHVQFFLDFDWASTELGPISSWPLDLRRMCNYLMADPRPASMFWGEQKTMMYNEAYVHVTGEMHPGMMGKVFLDAWGDVAGDFTSQFDEAATTGRGYSIDNARFNLFRHEYLEETYYYISMIPIQLGQGQIAL
jgi:hypothetical protein